MKNLLRKSFMKLKDILKSVGQAIGFKDIPQENQNKECSTTTRCNDKTKVKSTDTQTKRKTTPTTNAPTKRKTTPTTNAPTKRKTTPTTNAPTKRKTAPHVNVVKPKTGARDICLIGASLHVLDNCSRKSHQRYVNEELFDEYETLHDDEYLLYDNDDYCEDYADYDDF